MQNLLEHWALDEVGKEGALAYGLDVFGDGMQQHLALLNENSDLDRAGLQAELEEHHFKELRNQSLPDITLLQLGCHQQVQDERVGLNHVFIETEAIASSRFDSAHHCAWVTVRSDAFKGVFINNVKEVFVTMVSSIDLHFAVIVNEPSAILIVFIPDLASFQKSMWSIYVNLFF